MVSRIVSRIISRIVSKITLLEVLSLPMMSSGVSPLLQERGVASLRRVRAAGRVGRGAHAQGGRVGETSRLVVVYARRDARDAKTLFTGRTMSVGGYEPK